MNLLKPLLTLSCFLEGPHLRDYLISEVGLSVQNRIQVLQADVVNCCHGRWQKASDVGLETPVCLLQDKTDLGLGGALF